MLTPYRVLDLTDERAALGPMILGSMGAEVIRLDLTGWPRNGLGGTISTSSGENRFAGVVFDRCKGRLTLDLGQSAGRETLGALIRSADFLFENFPPGDGEGRPPGLNEACAANPWLVAVAISPYGQTGPRSRAAAEDITLAAMGGMVAPTGDADRAPVRVSVPQTWRHAAAESAVAALVGHRRMRQTGRAQAVDVSVQAAVFWTCMSAMTAAAIQGADIERAGAAMLLGPLTLPVVYECVDGYVVLNPTHEALPLVLAEAVREGIVDAAWYAQEDWHTYDQRVLTGEHVRTNYDQVIETVQSFCRRHSKGDLFRLGMVHGVTIAPINTVADILDFPHLEQRRYWTRGPAMPDVRMPGAFVRLSATPLTFTPPTTCRDGRDLLASRAAPAPVRPLAGELPLDGIRVADFSWIATGPMAGRYLADHGANVVRIETDDPIDRLRMMVPFKDGRFGINRSQLFASVNASKRSLALNLKREAGRRIAQRLIRWADVVLESFVPGKAAILGLNYDAVSALNPRAIMVSTSLLGTGGPCSALRGYGNHASALAGFYEVTGWPDRPPVSPQTYTDTIAPRFLAAAVLAALDHRERTGQGQYLEQAQLEAALHFLGPELVDYQLTGHIATRTGNADERFAPYGIYPCLGTEQWCAIAVVDDRQWRALARIVSHDGVELDAAFASLEGRLQHRRRLDDQIARWSSARDRYDVMARLVAAGVPAGAVQRSSDLLSDPQLLHRGFFRLLRHEEMGEVRYEGSQFTMSGYAGGPRFAAPCLGQHSLEVLRDDLNLSDDEIADAYVRGAVS